MTSSTTAVSFTLNLQHPFVSYAYQFTVTCTIRMVSSRTFFAITYTIQKLMSTCIGDKASYRLTTQVRLQHPTLKPLNSCTTDKSADRKFCTKFSLIRFYIALLFFELSFLMCQCRGFWSGAINGTSIWGTKHYCIPQCIVPLASFPGLSTIQFLIACSMLKQREGGVID